ncbi:MAG: PPC domain-containing protein [Caldilineaceae bacterium]|nr:PPC domain-containing protein [Caldilineaceae bacterium]
MSTRTLVSMVRRVFLVLLCLSLLPAISLSAQTDGDGPEPNDSFGKASPVAVNDTVQEQITPLRDVDWYAFTVPNQGELKILITNVASSLDIDVRVWNANRDAISAWIAPLAKGGDTQGSVDLPSAGRYYLEVRDGGDDAESAQAYTLQTTFTPAIDASEPNFDFGHAAPIVAAQTIQATILPVRDEDWYSFEVKDQGELQIAITGVPADLDISLRVWNANRDAISAWITPLAKGGDTKGMVDLPAPGRYYLEVRDGSDDARSVQPYSLTINFTESGDRAEPNNSFGAAALLIPAKSVDATILPVRDEDWYSFEVNHHGELQIAVTGVPADLDISLRVWNANRDAISAWITPLAKGGDTTGMVDLPAPGRYYLEVRDGSDDGRSIDPYTLTINFTPAVDANEPNNNFGAAAELGIDRSVQANILPVGDVDWYGLQADRSGELQIDVSDVAPNLDIVFRLWNANGDAVSGWIAPLAKGGNTSGLVDVVTPDRYLLEVRDSGDDARSIQPYTLKTRFSAIIDSGSTNDDFASAAPIALNTSTAGNIFPAGDHDWFSVDVAAAGDLHILVANVAPALTISVRVWNAQQSVIVDWTQPSTPGSNTELLVTLTEPGIYIIEIADNTGQKSSQPYVIYTSPTPIDPTQVTAPPTAASTQPSSTTPMTSTETITGTAADPGSIQISGQVGPMGNELLVTLPEDLLVNGARLEVPPGAVEGFVGVDIATSDSAPVGSPFGPFPAGKYWIFTPHGQKFSQPVTITLPVPVGMGAAEMFIGRWDGETWLDLGGEMENRLIHTTTDGFSYFAAFCGSFDDYQRVILRNAATGPQIQITFMSGPSPDPDTSDLDVPAGCQPFTGHPNWELKPDEAQLLQLRPGRYHLVVSYPQPQPGVANSLFFNVPVGGGEQTITIGDDGATSDNPAVTISFAGRTVTAGSNVRPTVACSATAPDGVAVINGDPGATALPSRIVAVGPMKLEQFKSEQITFAATATDPEGKTLRTFWTLSENLSGKHTSAGATVASGEALPGYAFKPTLAGRYTLFLTVYDEWTLFDECRWDITVTPNARPQVKVVSGRTVVEFGRLDEERSAGVGAIAPVSVANRPGIPGPYTIPSRSTAGVAVPWDGLTLCPTDIRGPFTALPDPNSIVATPTNVDALLPVAPPDVTNRWANPGRTCVWALLADADLDPLASDWEFPGPIFGSGTLFSAVTIPAGYHADLPDGLPFGSLLRTNEQLRAYNAFIADLYTGFGVIPSTVWEAWDDPCLTADGVQNPCPSAISLGGTENICLNTTDGFALPPTTNCASIAVVPEAVNPEPIECAYVMFIAEALPTPSDPAVGQGVIVRTQLSPPVAACPISFQIVGTDGYTNRATIPTNKNGEADFSIPGASIEATVDEVTISVCVPFLSDLVTEPSDCTTTGAGGFPPKPGKAITLRITYKF